MPVLLRSDGGRVMLQIASDLSLPLALVTQSIGVYGIKGSGKTFAAKVFAEECVAAGVQIVAIDPTDVWYGLRAPADALVDGLPVYVFGGEHGDVPLEAGSGELIADMVVDHGISAVLSLRHLRKAEQHRFVTAFAERLYHRKGEPAHRTPLHLFVDEAHSFAPQQVNGETARMVGAIEDLVRLGRSSGIGCTLISQRLASVNNNVRTQCETLICLRILAPHDRKALESWIEAHDSEGQGKEFLASLASLETGQAWIWSPPLDLFQRITVRRLRTFDSSATPKPGEERAKPVRTLLVDIDMLRLRMADMIERTKADDPKALRAEIARLTRELAARPESDESDLRAEIASLRDDRALLRRIIDGYGRVFGGALGMLDDIAEHAAGAASDIRAQLSREVPIREVPHESQGVPYESQGVPYQAPVAQSVAQPVRNRQAAGSNPAPSSTPSLGKAERDILGVLYHYRNGRSASQIGVLSGRKAGSGGFNNAVSSLRTKGLVEGTSACLRLTAEGEAIAGAFADAIPEPGEQRVAYWMAHPSVKRVSSAIRILHVLADAYPRSLPLTEVAALAGYSYGTGGFNNGVSRLRSLELAHGSGELRASDVLFEGVR